VLDSSYLPVLRIRRQYSSVATTWPRVSPRVDWPAAWST
jgi:hypothetical protein